MGNKQNFTCLTRTWASNLLYVVNSVPSRRSRSSGVESSSGSKSRFLRATMVFLRSRRIFFLVIESTVLYFFPSPSGVRHFSSELDSFWGLNFLIFFELGRRSKNFRDLRGKNGYLRVEQVQKPTLCFG